MSSANDPKYVNAWVAPQAEIFLPFRRGCMKEKDDDVMLNVRHAAVVVIRFELIFLGPPLLEEGASAAVGMPAGISMCPHS